MSKEQVKDEMEFLLFYVAPSLFVPERVLTFVTPFTFFLSIPPQPQPPMDRI